MDIQITVKANDERDQRQADILAVAIRALIRDDPRFQEDVMRSLIHGVAEQIHGIMGPLRKFQVNCTVEGLFE